MPEESDVYEKWFQWPHQEGLWWRRRGDALDPCYVAFKDNPNESESPVFYGFYLSMGETIKQALFEIDIPGVSWQKIKEPTYE